MTFQENVYDKNVEFFKNLRQLKVARNNCNVIAVSSVEVERGFRINIIDVKRKSLVMETTDNLITIPLLEIFGKI